MDEDLQLIFESMENSMFRQLLIVETLSNRKNDEDDKNDIVSALNKTNDSLAKIKEAINISFNFEKYLSNIDDKNVEILEKIKENNNNAISSIKQIVEIAPSSNETLASIGAILKESSPNEVGSEEILTRINDVLKETLSETVSSDETLTSIATALNQSSLKEASSVKTLTFISDVLKESSLKDKYSNETLTRISDVLKESSSKESSSNETLTRISDVLKESSSTDISSNDTLNLINETLKETSSTRISLEEPISRISSILNQTSENNANLIKEVISKNLVTTEENTRTNKDNQNLLSIFNSIVGINKEKAPEKLMDANIDTNEILEKIRESLYKTNDILESFFNYTKETAIETAEDLKRQEEFKTEESKEKDEEPKEKKSGLLDKLKNTSSSEIVKGLALAALAPFIGSFLEGFVKKLAENGLEYLGIEDSDFQSALIDGLGGAAFWGTIGRIFGRRFSILFAIGGAFSSMITGLFEENENGMIEAFGMEFNPSIIEGIGTAIGVALAAFLPRLLRRALPGILGKIGLGSILASFGRGAPAAATTAARTAATTAAPAAATTAARTAATTAAPAAATTAATTAAPAAATTAARTAAPAAATTAARTGVGFLGRTAAGLRAANPLALTGLGLDIGADVVGRDTAAGATLGVGASTANYAAAGALLGSFVPGVGTMIGGGIGAAIGTGIGLFQNWDTLFGESEGEQRIAAITAAVDSGIFNDIELPLGLTSGQVLSSTEIPTETMIEAIDGNQESINLLRDTVIAEAPRVATTEARATNLDVELTNLLDMYGSNDYSNEDQAKRILEILSLMKSGGIDVSPTRDIVRSNTYQDIEEQELRDYLQPTIDSPIDRLLRFAYDTGTPVEDILQGYRFGTRGFEDFGTGSIVALHGEEAVVPRMTPAGQFLDMAFSDNWLPKSDTVSDLAGTIIPSEVRDVISSSVQSIIRGGNAKYENMIRQTNDSAMTTMNAQRQLLMMAPNVMNATPVNNTNNVKNTTIVNNISPHRSLDDPSLPI